MYRKYKKGYDCMESENNYYDMNNISIPEIRFLPMSKKKEFKTYEEAVDFLSNEMPKKNGKYQYRTLKMDCEEGTLVLFQYNGELIASAKFLKNVKYEKTTVYSDGSESIGYYIFDSNSIRIFNEPITRDEYNKIDNSFKKFGQGTRKTEIDHLSKVLELIKFKINNAEEDIIYIPEEIIDIDGLPEGAKKKITINAYERNPEARNKCLEYYREKNNGKLKCEICGFDVQATYGEKFKNKIHIHHIKELSKIGEEYVVNPISDLLPVCPNCHMILHSKRPAYTPIEVQNFIRNKK